jgi:hypothetical protein
MFDQLTRRRQTATTATRTDVTIRPGAPGDGEALARLAALDSRAVPAEPVLVAEVGGEPWAAVSIADLEAVADPFRPTAELVWVLTERARQLRPNRRGGLRRRVPVLAG